MTPIHELPALGYRVILLGILSKKPASRGAHDVTTDADRIRRHRGNVGIMGGRHAVLDFDQTDIAQAMSAALGPLQPTVETGSGKLHVYIAHEPELPRYFSWAGQKVGEIVRRPTEYAVCPPSRHPDTRRAYRWLSDLREPLQRLPGAWRAHLLGCRETPPFGGLDLSTRPDFIPAGDTTGVDFGDDDGWSGPPADELLRRAMAQPGGSRRSHGVKFQCPGCRAEGHDRHRDNALVGLDGRWGCAVNSAHRRAIGEALGVLTPAREIPGYDSRLLRQLGVRL